MFYLVVLSHGYFSFYLPIFVFLLSPIIFDLCYQYVKNVVETEFFNKVSPNFVQAQIQWTIL